MYWLIEGEHRKGANTVASYIYDLLSLTELSIFKKIIIFSDAFPGQNRNKVILKSLVLLSNKYDIEIEQVFPIKGHSYCQCHRNFSNFSKQIKKIQIIQTKQVYVRLLEDFNFKVNKCHIFNWKKLIQTSFYNNINIQI